MKICDCGARLRDDDNQCPFCYTKFDGISWTNMIAVLVFLAALVAVVSLMVQL